MAGRQIPNASRIWNGVARHQASIPLQVRLDRACVAMLRGALR
jgi:hypothetical protein